MHISFTTIVNKAAAFLMFEHHPHLPLNRNPSFLPALLFQRYVSQSFTNWSPDVDGDDAGYRFDNPAVPAVTIPTAWPNSIGDMVIVEDNPIVTKAGDATETNCNGDQAEYYGEDGYWHREVGGGEFGSEGWGVVTGAWHQFST